MHWGYILDGRKIASSRKQMHKLFNVTSSISLKFHKNWKNVTLNGAIFIFCEVTGVHPSYNFDKFKEHCDSNLLNRTKSYYLYFWEDYLYWLMEQVVIGIELFTKQFDCNNNQFGCERIQLHVVSNPFAWICKCMLELKQELTVTDHHG